MSLGEKDRDYIRMVAREAANEAIRHMTENGFMPMLREEARLVAESHVEKHAQHCPLSVKVQSDLSLLEGKLKLSMAKIVIGVLMAGGAGGISARVVSVLMGGLNN